jgi:hypothetical protein
MSLDDCDTILRQVCQARGMNPVQLIQAPRATRDQLLIKGQAIHQMREARATWINIARVMFYRHHSQAMYARRAYLETVKPGDVGADAPGMEGR